MRQKKASQMRTIEPALVVFVLASFWAPAPAAGSGDHDRSHGDFVSRPSRSGAQRANERLPPKLIALLGTHGGIKPGRTRVLARNPTTGKLESPLVYSSWFKRPGCLTFNLGFRTDPHHLFMADWVHVGQLNDPKLEDLYLKRQVEMARSAIADELGVCTRHIPVLHLEGPTHVRDPRGADGAITDLDRKIISRPFLKRYLAWQGGYEAQERKSRPREMQLLWHTLRQPMEGFCGRIPGESADIPEVVLSIHKSDEITGVHELLHALSGRLMNEVSATRHHGYRVLLEAINEMYTRRVAIKHLGYEASGIDPCAREVSFAKGLVERIGASTLKSIYFSGEPGMLAELRRAVDGQQAGQLHGACESLARMDRIRGEGPDAADARLKSALACIGL